MNTNSKSGSSTSILSRAAQLGLAALLGVVIVGVVGFSHVEAAHNAAHDYRHSMAFPCH
jgi:cobalt transporter subunit CbtB